jgi:crossover junction endonuclease EME1
LKLVTWRRRVKAEYDEDLTMFVPLEHEEIRNEGHVLVYLTAQEFVDVALLPSSDALSAHVQRIKAAFTPPPGKDIRLIYLIEGLAALVRKHKNLKNRAYQNRVLANIPSAPGGGGTVSADPSVIEEDAVEFALLELQITHGCLIHHTAVPMETVEWVTTFTGDISTIPYKFLSPRSSHYHSTRL